MKFSYENIVIPEGKKATCKISHYTDYTGINSDLDDDIHEGFTVGNGKQMYWEMIWHSWGNVTVYNKESGKPRWLRGDTIITIHFK